MGETLKYYSFGPVMSRNAQYNFIIGARGLGKTYGAKKKAIKDFITRGDQFIYLRRYSTELKSSLPTIFADIFHEFPDYDFDVKGFTLLCRRKGEKKWDIIGYGVALSKAQQKKSVAYPDVKTIIFDEFIIDKGAVHYLPEEARAFNDFYSTVDRWKDKTRVFFLANSVSIMNPYFIEYDVRIDGQEWTSLYDGFMVVHCAKSADFSAGVYETKFGKFIQGTEYADYAVGTEFTDNGRAMLGKRDAEYRYVYTLETRSGTFAVWVKKDAAHWFIDEKRPKQEWVITMLPELMTEEKRLVNFNNKLLQNLRTGYAKGRVTFSSPQSRNAFTGVYKRSTT